MTFQGMKLGYLVFGSKIIGATDEILRGVHGTIGNGVEGAKKIGKIMKISISEPGVGTLILFLSLSPKSFQE